jgi:hypothetical protein
VLHPEKRIVGNPAATMPLIPAILHKIPELIVPRFPEAIVPISSYEISTSSFKNRERMAGKKKHLMDLCQRNQSKKEYKKGGEKWCLE